MISLLPAALRTRTGAFLRGHGGRSKRALLLSKLPGHGWLTAGAQHYASFRMAQQLLAERDLTDSAQGTHAMQTVVAEIADAMGTAYGVPARYHAFERLVGLSENYVRLGFDRSAINRDQRYSYRLGPNLMLRTHLSAGAPDLLHALRNEQGMFDELFILPGLAYRRDVIDRFHAAVFHQADYWRFRRGPAFTQADLHAMLAQCMAAVLPGHEWRTTPTRSPYTRHGFQVDVRYGDTWVEVGEGGIVAPSLFAREGLDAQAWSGVSFGFGLDRLLMLRKGMPDIRLLRVALPEVQAQLQHLEPWVSIDTHAVITHELELVLATDMDEDLIGDHVRQLLGEHSSHVQAVEILRRRQYDQTRELVQLQLHFQALTVPLSPADVQATCEALTLTGPRH